MFKSFSIIGNTEKESLLIENRALRERLNKIQQMNENLNEVLLSQEKQLVDLFELKAKIEQLQNYVDLLEEENNLRRRLDGRPSKFNRQQKENIRRLRRNGLSINKIAEQYNCSNSVIHGVVKDIGIDLRKKKL